MKATAALAEAVANGDITPGEAGELSKLVDGFTKAVELHEIQQRLDKLEAMQGAEMSRTSMRRLERLEGRLLRSLGTCTSSMPGMLRTSKPSERI